MAMATSSLWLACESESELVGMGWQENEAPNRQKNNHFISRLIPPSRLEKSGEGGNLCSGPRVAPHTAEADPKGHVWCL